MVDGGGERSGVGPGDQILIHDDVRLQGELIIVNGLGSRQSRTDGGRHAAKEDSLLDGIIAGSGKVPDIEHDDIRLRVNELVLARIKFQKLFHLVGRGLAIRGRERVLQELILWNT